MIGGAKIARQYLEAALLAEVHLHVVPILLEGGVRLFEGRGATRLGARPGTGILGDRPPHLSRQELR